MEASPESVLTEPPYEGSSLTQRVRAPCQPFRRRTEFISFLSVNWLTLKIRSTFISHASMRALFSWVCVSPLRHDSSLGKIGISLLALASFGKIGTSPIALASFGKIGTSLIALASTLVVDRDPSRPRSCLDALL